MQRTIYIIDDDLVSQFATQYCIRQYEENFNIETFANGEEALAALSDLVLQRSTLPDIIFLDLVMDGMYGWEFLDEFHRLSKGHKQPKVYILSAFVNSKDRDIAKAHPLIAGYIDKPLSRNSVNVILTAKTEGNPSTL